MAEIALHATTGDDEGDRLVRGVVALGEAAFPSRVRGYYIEGSAADGGATALSDLDIRIVFSTPLSVDEASRFGQFVAGCRSLSPWTLDLSATDEETLWQASARAAPDDPVLVLGLVTLKRGSRLAYGEDIRPGLPDPPPDLYARAALAFALTILAAQRGNAATLPTPLPPPDPTAPYLGYAARPRRGRDGQTYPSTRRLVHAASYIATALVAIRAGDTSTTKREAVANYRRWINDEWADHLDAIHQWCRLAWAYRLPDDPTDQARLHALCERQVAFENHFLAHCRAFLQREHTHPDEEVRQFAARRLTLIASGDAPAEEA